MNFGALDKDYTSVTSNYSQLDQVNLLYNRIFVYTSLREILLKIMAMQINLIETH